MLVRQAAWALWDLGLDSFLEKQIPPLLRNGNQAEAEQIERIFAGILSKISVLFHWGISHFFGWLI